MRYQIIYWRDVPTQVRGKNGRKRSSVMLADRFQKAAYRAAFRAKAINGDAYAEGFRNSDWSTAEGMLDEVIARVVNDVEQEYNDERLNQLALNKGFEEI